MTVALQVTNEIWRNAANNELYRRNRFMEISHSSMNLSNGPVWGFLDFEEKLMTRCVRTIGAQPPPVLLPLFPAGGVSRKSHQFGKNLLIKQKCNKKKVSRTISQDRDEVCVPMVRTWCTEMKQIVALHQRTRWIRRDSVKKVKKNLPVVFGSIYFERQCI